MPNLLSGEYNESIEVVVRTKVGNSWEILNIKQNPADAMHPNAIFEGKDYNVFVKMGGNSFSYDQFTKEANGLNYIRENSNIYTPEILGVVKHGQDTLIIMEAIHRKPIETKKDWEIIGRGLAVLHKTTFEKCGFFEDNYLGIWEQNNDYRNNWLDFYTDMRLRKMVERTTRSGSVTKEELCLVERLIERLPDISGPEQPYSLLHGDPWMNTNGEGNLLYDGEKLIIIDCSTYYGNREIDLSTVALFYPVTNYFFDAYNEEYPIENGYKEREELWRINQRISFICFFNQSYKHELNDIIKKYL